MSLQTEVQLWVGWAHVPFPRVQQMSLALQGLQCSDLEGCPSVTDVDAAVRAHLLQGEEQGCLAGVLARVYQVAGGPHRAVVNQVQVGPGGILRAYTWPVRAGVRATFTAATIAATRDDQREPLVVLERFLVPLSAPVHPGEDPARVLVAALAEAGHPPTVSQVVMVFPGGGVLKGDGMPPATLFSSEQDLAADPFAGPVVAVVEPDPAQAPRACVRVYRSLPTATLGDLDALAPLDCATTWRHPAHLVDDLRAAYPGCAFRCIQDDNAGASSYSRPVGPLLTVAVSADPSPQAVCVVQDAVYVGAPGGPGVLVPLAPPRPSAARDFEDPGFVYRYGNQAFAAALAAGNMVVLDEQAVAAMSVRKVSDGASVVAVPYVVRSPSMVLLQDTTPVRFALVGEEEQQEGADEGGRSNVVQVMRVPTVLGRAMDDLKLRDVLRACALLACGYGHALAQLLREPLPKAVVVVAAEIAKEGSAGAMSMDVDADVTGGWRQLFGPHHRALVMMMMAPSTRDD